MNYQVLARKYRPSTFEQVVGQEHVLRVLINMLDQNRLHPGCLFSGGPGVGKTTLARLFAKCINCMSGVTSKPCEVCTACQEVNAGCFLDLIEVDAASRTKVEDTRELLENVSYVPTRGRYKVYLIDEVHMLSTHSFNALLKTLEEPPPHVVFLLATTDPQRLPATVLSRCLQFHLKNLAPSQIAMQLEQVLKQENIAYEAGALKLLAHAANGSLRDALSLLDQAIGYTQQQLDEQAVRVMLGMIERKFIFNLIEALLANSAAAIIDVIRQLAEQAADFSVVLEELISTLQRIAVAQLVPDAQTNDYEDEEKVLQLAKHMALEDVQLYYQIALIGRRDLPLSPTLRGGFEMLMLRMLVFTPTSAEDQQTESSVVAAPPVVPESSALDWLSTISQLGLSGVALALANHCCLKEFKDDCLHLLLDPAQVALRSARQEKNIADALRNYFKRPVSLKMSVGTAGMATPAQLTEKQKVETLRLATQTLENDPKLQMLIKTFDAKIQPDSVQIVEHPIP